MENWNRIIYKMTSTINGEYYIGKCVVPKEYRNDPLKQVEKYYNKKISEAKGKKEITEFESKLLKIGMENFVFEILCYCEYDERYYEENIFKKYLLNEKNPKLLLYKKQKEYVENLINKEN